MSDTIPVIETRGLTCRFGAQQGIALPALEYPVCGLAVRAFLPCVVAPDDGHGQGAGGDQGYLQFADCHAYATSC